MNKKNFFSEVDRLRGAKTDLKSQKIMLAATDNIREFLDLSYLEDTIEERIDEASSKMVEARDIFRFDMMSNLGSAEDDLRFLKEQLDNLGVDYPAVVTDFESEIKSRETAAEDIRRRFQDMGWDPIS
tara:strand:+ start:2167 stop:2550 length:384 start_codon:yes stop_codon:yes gene_type:complete